MTTSEGPGKPQSPLTPACRAFLRNGMAEDDHASGCAFCSARLGARRKLGEWLAQPIAPPAELESAAFLDSIKTRIVDRAEASALGQLLDQAMPVASPAALERAFPVDLLDSAVGTSAVGDPTGDLVGSVGELGWARVRQRVLQQMHADRSRHLARFRMIAVFGVAAAAILCSILVSEGTRRPPSIVFTDVSSVPSLEFSPMAVLRHGTDH